MLNNNNTSVGCNDFSEMPFFPYKILEVLISDDSQTANDFWKLLQYGENDALDNDNLSLEEKRSLVWKNDSIEQTYSVFLKPYIGSSMDSAEAQTQLRLFRYNTMPYSQFEAVICFEADFITNEKTSMVYKDGMLCERTDLMESLFLSLFNMRDIEIGSGYLTFNKELSRSCGSQLNITNSKSLYGRSLILALDFVNGETANGC